MRSKLGNLQQQTGRAAREHCLADSAFVLLLLLVGTQVACRHAKWSRFSPPDQSFSVTLPGVAKQSLDSLVTPLGKISFHMYFYARADAAYGAGYVDYPVDFEKEGTVEAAFEGGRDYAVANAGGRLLHESVVWYESHPGREFLIEAANGAAHLKMRCFLAGSRMYELTSVVPSQKAFLKPYTDEVDSLFESFRIHGPRATAEP